MTRYFQEIWHGIFLKATVQSPKICNIAYIYYMITVKCPIKMYGQLFYLTWRKPLGEGTFEGFPYIVVENLSERSVHLAWSIKLAELCGLLPNDHKCGIYHYIMFTKKLFCTVQSLSGTWNTYAVATTRGSINVYTLATCWYGVYYYFLTDFYWFWING